MIVDASAIVDLVLERDPMASWVDGEVRRAERLRAPHVIDAEVAGAIRRIVLAGAMTADRGASALDDFAALPIRRFAQRRMLRRVWLLRNNVSTFDAFYVVLAEAFSAPLLTTDAALARAPGLDIEIRAFT